LLKHHLICLIKIAYENKSYEDIKQLLKPTQSNHKKAPKSAISMLKKLKTFPATQNQMFGSKRSQTNRKKTKKKSPLHQEPKQTCNVQSIEEENKS
jgi:hypothetical protein